MFMDWIRFHKTDSNGRHYWQVYSVPYTWNAATPKAPGTGRIAEAAALAYSIIWASGYAWQVECHCVECTIKAKSLARSSS